MKKILNQKGFTLIELLIVMLIISILAIAVAPRFMNLQADAQQRTCQGNQAAMDTATEIARYKAGDPDLAPDAADLVGEGMLKTAPFCPTAGDDSTYSIDGNDRWTCSTNDGDADYDHGRD